MGLPFLASSNDFEKEINFTGTSTITNGNIQLIPLSTGLGLNVPTSGDFRLSVNGTTALTLSASLATLASTNGLYFTSATGTVTGSQRMVVPTSTGININVPTSKDLRISVNDGVSLTIDVDGFIVPQDKYGYFGAASIKAGSDAIVQFNTPTGNGYAWTASSTVVLTSDVGLLTVGSQHGIKLDSSIGTITSSDRQIAGTSTGVSFNVPTSLYFTWSQNGTDFANMTPDALQGPLVIAPFASTAAQNFTLRNSLDTGLTTLCGGSGVAQANGSFIMLYGSDYSGEAQYYCGDVSGAAHKFYDKNGAERFRVNELGIHTPGALIFTTNYGLLKVTSTDGSDNGTLDLSSYGGAALNEDRGASIRLTGNENADISGFYPGSITFQLGDVSGAQYRFAGKNGFTAENYVTIDETTVTLASGLSLIVTTSQTPANSGATGTAGTIAWDTNYVYVCTATNTWKRVAIATW